jgi:hypothetical protein
MLHLEFHHLFKPLFSETSSKKNEKLSKSSKSKLKKQSMSRDMRGIASGILRQMLHQKGSQHISSLICSQTQRNDSPFIELNLNASEFCVFAAIRQCVLERQLKNSALIFNSTFGRISSNDNESEDELTDNKNKESVMKVSIISFIYN